MLRLDYQQHELAFEYPFQISKGMKTHQPTLAIFLGLGAQYGLGEATAIQYYNTSMESMIHTLDKYASMIKKYAYNGPERFWHYLHHLIPNDPFLIAALDCASWDMWSKLQGLSVRDMLRLEIDRSIPSDYTIGIGSAEETLEKYAAHPYPIIKLKVGNNPNFDQLKTLLEHTKATIRLDANEAWNEETLHAYLPLLDPERIECLEQPFHRDDLALLKLYKGKCEIPVIADEAIFDMNSLQRLLPYYDGVNIKLSKCSGLTPSLAMIKQIKEANKKVMLGSMSESNIGAAALAQLLPLADYADIDGPLLLKENIGSALIYDKDGNIQFPHKMGIGIEWQ